LGYLDDEGDLWVVQRRSDLIISGGENVYVAEVEQTLVQHPAVVEACVVGLPDAEWGQRVAALVVVSQAVSAEDLLSFVRERLAGYKVPQLVRFVAGLPLTGSGKVSRAAVIELLSPTAEPAP
jgi:O-succinylbenzoic acid--CoA ligase